MVARKRVKYSVVDAFADSAFKGNPAAVCFLDDDDKRDNAWLQSLAAEFNLSETCFLTPITVSDVHPRFSLRWFTPVAEVDLCGHATLASAHVIFSNSLVDSEVVEFATRSGILTAKRVPLTSEIKDGGEEKESTFFIELDFPVVPTCEVNSATDLSVFSNAVNGATIVDIKATAKDVLVVLSSWESVTKMQPRIDEISKCPCEGLMVTAAASAGSQYDFCSRYFAPNFGINEDPVTGSAHCALAHYWSTKMNKCDFLAYQASSRGGTLNVHLDKEKQRVLLRGKAITVMEGCVLV
ncbi:hypothetical protein HA466_0186780 [Hirschfeldia incana]|nr:hypothetical protein HA466_0186780 [Hirschfeldia incana]